MLYNPEWSKPSLAGFIAWLEQQNPSEKFVWFDWRACAVSQYLQSIGTNWHKETDRDVVMVRQLDKIAQEAGKTFGAVLKEARRAQQLVQA